MSANGSRTKVFVKSIPAVELIMGTIYVDQSATVTEVLVQAQAAIRAGSSFEHIRLGAYMVNGVTECLLLPMEADAIFLDEVNRLWKPGKGVVTIVWLVQNERSSYFKLGCVTLCKLHIWANTCVSCRAVAGIRLNGVAFLLPRETQQRQHGDGDNRVYSFETSAAPVASVEKPRRSIFNQMLQKLVSVFGGATKDTQDDENVIDSDKDDLNGKARMVSQDDRNQSVRSLRRRVRRHPQQD
jgi:hypothetical protein